MKKFTRVFSFALFLFLFIFPLFVRSFATMGVGVTIGKIQVDDRLMAGTIYKLPQFNVVNTGDEPSNFQVDISYRDGQEELMPAQEWFVFKPETFYLEPGDYQAVEIELRIPVKAVPGDYLAFIGGSPIIVAEEGQSVVGISAATKLYFTIAPSNLLQGIYYRLISLWKKYLPWTNISGAVVLAALFLLILSKFIKIDVKLKKSGVSSRQYDKNSKS